MAQNVNKITICWQLPQVDDNLCSREPTFPNLDIGKTQIILQGFAATDLQ
jgi:hypothetical protein